MEVVGRILKVDTPFLHVRKLEIINVDAPGFKGDGIKGCKDECKEKTACQCPECSYKDVWGGYECTCSGDLLYIKEHDTCISKSAKVAKATWDVVWANLIALAIAGVGAYTIYKYRLRANRSTRYLLRTGRC